MALMMTWCLALAAYLLFAGGISRNELGTALVLATLSASWSLVIRRNSRLRFRVTLATIGHVTRAIIAVPAATLRTGATLARVIVRGGSPGRSYESRFRYGPSGARERLRRAVALLCASLAPDRFVVDLKHGAVLIHHIVRRGHEPDDRWLE